MLDNRGKKGIGGMGNGGTYITGKGSEEGL